MSQVLHGEQQLRSAVRDQAPRRACRRATRRCRRSGLVRRRRSTQPIAPKPTLIIAQDAGSGTASETLTAGQSGQNLHGRRLSRESEDSDQAKRTARRRRIAPPITPTPPIMKAHAGAPGAGVASPLLSRNDVRLPWKPIYSVMPI